MEPTHIVKVSGLKEGTTPLRMELRPHDLDVTSVQGCAVRIEKTAVADLALLKSHDRLYVKGKVEFQAHLTCADCLTEFDQRFSEPVSIEYEHGAPAYAGPKIHELGEDELERAFYQGDEIDLLPMIRDTVVLAIPLAPMCRPDCRGICPECGANLNAGECTCCSPANSARVN